MPNHYATDFRYGPGVTGVPNINTPSVLPNIPNVDLFNPQAANAGNIPFGALSEFGGPQGQQTQVGLLGPGLAAIGGLSGIYLGAQQNRLAKRGLDFQRRAFSDQLARLDQDYRNQLENQYRRRNPGRDVSASDLQAYIDARTV